MDKRTQPRPDCSRGGTISRAGHAWLGTGLVFLLLGLPALSRGQAAAERQPQEATAVRINPGPLCAGQAEGTECWLELTGQPGCYLFMFGLIPYESVTWTGACVNGFAHGTGTLTRVFRGDGGKNTTTGATRATGRIRHGKRHGPWVSRLADGAVWEGPFVDGKHHGQWIIRGADGDVWEGPFVDGKLHGQWIIRQADGAVWKGPYVDDQRHGQWVLRYANGEVWEGPYVDGQLQGQWIIRQADGTLWKGPYVDDQRQGQWVILLKDRTLWKGPYVDGQRQGRWVILRTDGTLGEATYVNDELQRD